MVTSSSAGLRVPYRLRTSRVLRVDEHACQVWNGTGERSVRFAPAFPSPRVERVSPGHLVATTLGPNGEDVMVWRWYDAVVLGRDSDGAVRLWEPAHGEVLARPRKTYKEQEPGTRAYASSGLPGAQWWVAASAQDAQVAQSGVDVDLDEVAAFYTENGLWSTVFETRP